MSEELKKVINTPRSPENPFEGGSVPTTTDLAREQVKTLERSIKSLDDAKERIKRA